MIPQRQQGVLSLAGQFSKPSCPRVFHYCHKDEMSVPVCLDFLCHEPMHVRDGNPQSLLNVLNLLLKAWAGRRS